VNKSKKEHTRYVCQNCGADAPRWLGRCPACDAWNSLVEEKAPATTRSAMARQAARSLPVPLAQINSELAPRCRMASAELDRVLGGGMVPGSVVLIGGDPGIGKSTLLLQEAAGLAAKDFTVLYVTGEESIQQSKMRAERLEICSDYLYLLAETELENVLSAMEQLKPQWVIIDSIQTMYTDLLESAPGSISQVRECALQLLQFAKRGNIPIFLVGHVTKEGFLAGPKVLEHMVDALILFEGDREHFYRILRAAKNRFGSTREIGVFEMTDKGLKDVGNPSDLFLSQRCLDSSGAAVICCMEGTRPILVEIQALVSPSNYGLPQRNTTGIDIKRLQMLLAVLEKRLGYRIGAMDVYANAAGGFRLDETAADLGILCCLASSLRNKPIDAHTLLLGEVGLSGELRTISHIDSRLHEAGKMGFKQAIIPAGNHCKTTTIKTIAVEKAEQALQFIL
jgi:DNA repair protein RadA/Sms